MCKYSLYCELVNIWVKGETEDGHFIQYTTNESKAKRFETKAEAEKYKSRLPVVWQSRVKAMEHTESTRLHDEYFSRGHSEGNRFCTP